MSLQNLPTIATSMESFDENEWILEGKRFSVAETLKNHNQLRKL